MNKSILFFVGGTVFGVILSVFTMSSPSINSASIDGELDKISSAIEELGNTTDKLNKLVETYTYVLPKSPIQQPSINSNTPDEAMPAADFTEDQNSNIQQRTNQITSLNTETQNTNITPVQASQYESIDATLTNAANNHSLILTDLIKDASNLSDEQRQKLTIKAMQMIRSGELKTEQFMQ